jgi:triacylglycerol esterase/lipase EstA (alpha/beta hydrolase family)
MTLQASGPISFSQISNEFGIPTGKNLGAYRVSQTVGTLSNLPLDTGIPQSGQIGFSNFYSKKLNVVVDLHSIPNFSTRQTARVRYNNQNVTVIGGFKTRPPSSANTRVIINVNSIIGSDLGSINNVALATGGWEGNTQLELEIGPSGQLYGSGGNGGKGALLIQPQVVMEVVP